MKTRNILTSLVLSAMLGVISFSCYAMEQEEDVPSVVMHAATASNPDDKDGNNALVTAIAPSLEPHLDWRGRQIEEGEVQSLTEGIYNGTLHSLNLNRANMEMYVARSLLFTLDSYSTRSNLVTLDISNNKIHISAFEMLASFLQQNRSLQELRVANTFKDFEFSGLSEVEVISKGLINSTLTKIDLRNNDITNKGAHALELAIMRNRIIREVDIRGNKVNRDIEASVRKDWSNLQEDEEGERYDAMRNQLLSRVNNPDDGQGELMRDLLRNGFSEELLVYIIQYRHFSSCFVEELLSPLQSGEIASRAFLSYIFWGQEFDDPRLVIIDPWHVYEFERLMNLD